MSDPTPAVWKVWSAKDPDQPVCYVEAANDGRAIIHAYLHEDSEEFRDHGIDAMQAEAVTLSGPLSMRVLTDDRRASLFCATCGESLFRRDRDEPEPAFCCQECRVGYDPTMPAGLDHETMICLYQDV